MLIRLTVYTTSQRVEEEDVKNFIQTVDEMVPDIEAMGNQFLVKNLILSNFKPSEDSNLIALNPDNRKLELRQAIREHAPRMLNNLFVEISEMIREELQKLQYLGPLRSYPPRHFAFSQTPDKNWYAGGGYAWDVVRTDEKIRELVNNWLSAPDRLKTRYKLKVRDLITWDDIEGFYSNLISDLENRVTNEEESFDGDMFGELYGEIPTELAIEANRYSELNELNLVDLNSDTIVSHRDVGLGVSQVLPVLVSAYASENKIIAIEQPEIHLHPALQADLSDVFIESAIGPQKNRFLLESHSEHLLLRVLRRIRETTLGKLPKDKPSITPDDVCVLFVEQSEKGSRILEIGVNDKGDLVDQWPGGFFEEGYEELF